MPVSSLQELYDAKLQLILDAEQQGLVNNPSLIEQVQRDELRQALQAHLQQTERQVEMLQPLVQQGARQGGATSADGGQPAVCASMQALFREAQQMVGQITDPDTRDAYVIAAAQAIEHHEIAAYGTARAWAQQLGRDQDAQVLEQILAQEKQTDELLTQLAERRVNQEAAQGDAMGDVPSDREVPVATGSEMGGSGSGARAGSGPGPDAELSAEA